jgi:hypothetical protein
MNEWSNVRPHWKRLHAWWSNPRNRQTRVWIVVAAAAVLLGTCYAVTVNGRTDAHTNEACAAAGTIASDPGLRTSQFASRWEQEVLPAADASSDSGISSGARAVLDAYTAGDAERGVVAVRAFAQACRDAGAL